MTSPKGLGIEDTLLFVCDKDELKVFNAKDPLSLRQINSFYVPGATDVIANNNRLILISKKGLTQYSYENSNIVELSSIHVE